MKIKKKHFFFLFLSHIKSKIKVGGLMEWLVAITKTKRKKQTKTDIRSWKRLFFFGRKRVLEWSKNKKQNFQNRSIRYFQLAIYHTVFWIMQD